MNREARARPQGFEVLQRAVAPVVLFIAVSALYMHAVRYDFIYDDHTLIVNHPAPRSAGEVLGVFAEGHWLGLPYYRPVARLTMVVQKYLHGDDAAPYHAFNALLMGVLAVLTWFLLRQPALGICPGPASIPSALDVRP